jgi:hypothetical protein
MPSRDQVLFYLEESFLCCTTVTSLEDFAVLGVVSGVRAIAVLGTARLLLLKFLLLGRLVGSLGDLS